MIRLDQLGGRLDDTVHEDSLHPAFEPTPAIRQSSSRHVTAFLALNKRYCQNFIFLSIQIMRQIG